MFTRLSFAQSLLFGGLVLGVLGLVLWWHFPFTGKYPPFALTALLAVVYGAVELWRGRNGRRP